MYTAEARREQKQGTRYRKHRLTCNISKSENATLKVVKVCFHLPPTQEAYPVSHFLYSTSLPTKTYCLKSTKFMLEGQL